MIEPSLRRRFFAVQPGTIAIWIDARAPMNP
jgi:hypothetical protein